MEYHQIINLLGNTPSQPSNTNSQIKLKTTMLKSNLCDYLLKEL